MGATGQRSFGWTAVTMSWEDTSQVLGQGKKVRSGVTSRPSRRGADPTSPNRGPVTGKVSAMSKLRGVAAKVSLTMLGHDNGPAGALTS
jgi:hypothetical protein